MVIPEISGRTKPCGLIGYPVEHTLSPQMHNAAFRYLGLEYVYLPFSVLPQDLGQAVVGLRALGFVGFNVTVPHKERIIPYLDEVDEGAGLAGAVNTVVREGERLKGYNTDGAGFVRHLETEVGFTAKGKRVLVLGAGGAAKAVAVYLALAGAKEVIIANRTFEKARKLAQVINEKTPAGASAVAWNPTGEEQVWEDAEALKEVVASADLVVQTTSLGMHPREDVCPHFPYEALGDRHLVVDIIYNPTRTLFLQEAAKRGARVQNGMGMLLYQGAMAFELWTGRAAPLDVMRGALPF